MAASIDHWALEYRIGPGFDHPKDADFVLTERAYWDLEFFGELWDSYCNPEVILYNQKYTTNDGNPLTFRESWRLRWLPTTGGVLPEGFIVKTWKVIIYSDANRTSIVDTITGNININDQYLIDYHFWFVSKILDVTPYKNIGINQSVDIFCKVLQPAVSYLEITVQKNQETPITIFAELITDLVRDKIYTVTHIFGSAGLYTVKYKLTTSFDPIRYIDNWCKPVVDYVEEEESFVEVGGTT